MIVHVDLYNGKTADVCCLSCRGSYEARYTMASPVRHYIVALSCEECMGQLVAWHVDSHVRVKFIDRLWRAV